MSTIGTITKIGDISKEELDLLLSYLNREVHCIKEKAVTVNVGTAQYINHTLGSIQKNDFYKISTITFRNNEKTYSYTLSDMVHKIYDEPDYKYFSISISCGSFTFHYENFFEHFELRTLQDIRRDKIKSILD